MTSRSQDPQLDASTDISAILDRTTLPIIVRGPVNGKFGLREIIHIDADDAEDEPPPSLVRGVFATNAGLGIFQSPSFFMTQIFSQTRVQEWQEKIFLPFNAYCRRFRRPLLEDRITQFHHQSELTTESRKAHQLAAVLYRQTTTLLEADSDNEAILETQKKLSETITSLLSEQRASALFMPSRRLRNFSFSHHGMISEENQRNLLDSITNLDSYIARKQIEFWKWLSIQVGYEPESDADFSVNAFKAKLQADREMLMQSMQFAVRAQPTWPFGHFEVLEQILNECTDNLYCVPTEKEKDSIIKNFLPNLLSIALESKNVDSIVILLKYFESLTSGHTLTKEKFNSSFDIKYQKVWNFAIETKNKELIYHLLSCKQTFLFLAQGDSICLTRLKVFYSQNIVPFLVQLNDLSFLEIILMHSREDTNQTIEIVLPFITEAAKQDKTQDSRLPIFKVATEHYERLFQHREPSFSFSPMTMIQAIGSLPFRASTIRALKIATNFQEDLYQPALNVALNIAAKKGSIRIFEASLELLLSNPNRKYFYHSFYYQWDRILETILTSHNINPEFIFFVFEKIPSITRVLHDAAEEEERSKSIAVTNAGSMVSLLDVSTRNLRDDLNRFSRCLESYLPKAAKCEQQVLARFMVVYEECLNKRRTIDERQCTYSEAIREAAAARQYENVDFLLSYNWPQLNALTPQAEKNLIEAIHTLIELNQIHLAFKILNIIPFLKGRFIEKYPRTQLLLCKSLASAKKWDLFNEYFTIDLLNKISVFDDVPSITEVRANLNDIFLQLIQENQRANLSLFFQCDPNIYKSLFLFNILTAVQTLIERDQLPLATQIMRRSSILENTVLALSEEADVVNVEEIDFERDEIVEAFETILLLLARQNDFVFVEAALNNDVITNNMTANTTRALYRLAKDNDNVAMVALILRNQNIARHIVADDELMREGLIDALDIDIPLEFFLQLWRLYDFDTFSPSDETFKAVVANAFQERDKIGVLEAIAQTRNLPANLVTILGEIAAQQRTAEITEDQCRIILQSIHFPNFSDKTVKRLLSITVRRRFNDLAHLIVQTRQFEQLSTTTAAEMLCISSSWNQKSNVDVIMASTHFENLKSYDLWKAHQLAKNANHTAIAKALYNSSRGWDIFWQRIWQSILSIMFFWKTSEIKL